jgi:hypothetical protein
LALAGMGDFMQTSRLAQAARPFVASAGIMLWLGAIATAATDPAAVEIGSTITVENEVSALSGPKPGIVTTGDVIFKDEEIQTGPGASAEFRFADETVFAMSENSKIKLDEFVYDPAAQGIGKLAVTAVVGSFRFVSGKVPKDNIEINTPQGSIGVRGTAFDLYVAEDGETNLGLLEGEVKLCNRGRAACRDLKIAGRFLRLTALGVLEEPRAWTRELLRGVAFERAFPFIVNQGRVTPRFRVADNTIAGIANFVERGGGIAKGRIIRQVGGQLLNHGLDIGGKAGLGAGQIGKTLGGAVKKPGAGVLKAIQKPKLPKLPNLLKK